MKVGKLIADDSSVQFFSTENATAVWLVLPEVKEIFKGHSNHMLLTVDVSGEIVSKHLNKLKK